MMTYREALTAGARRLENKADSPYLDSVLLLSFACGLTKEQIFERYPEEISNQVSEEFLGLIDRRLSGYPVSYILKKKEFYSLEFHVDPRVLVPRPDTEILVDAAIGLRADLPARAVVHDACTGSGCIGITLQHEVPEFDVSVSDVSPDALEVCQYNSKNILGRILPHYRSDLLDNVPGRFDLITANPPYLTSGDAGRIAESGSPEPVHALDGGPDGLAVFRRLVPQAYAKLNRGGALLLEADPEQMDDLRNLLVQKGYRTIIIYRDLAGRDRVIQGKR